MISFIKGTGAGYISKLKIENDKMLMVINVPMFFPNTKRNINKLCEIMEECEGNTDLQPVIQSLVNELNLYRDEEIKSCAPDNRYIEKLNRNVCWILMYFSMYIKIGDTIV